MIEKTAASYNEFLLDTAKLLKNKLDNGKISMQEYDKAMKHIREQQDMQAEAQDS